MQHVEGAGTRLRLPAAGLDLEQTLGCGQSFRWRARADGGFEGCAGARFARVKCADGALIVEGPPAPDFEAFWSDYFDLGRDYDALRARFSRVDALAPAVAYAGGIHLLRQDGWEALASFILSQNNNIKRISGIIERLCTAFGPPCAEGWSGFPGPERLASLDVEALAPLRAGFRARYLLDAAQRVCSGEVSLAALETLPLPEARAMLMQIVGVGRKVADCALLFGFHRLESFPVDVWIARAMAELFPDGLPPELADCAGVAQQLLFHYRRTGPARAGGGAGTAVAP